MVVKAGFVDRKVLLALDQVGCHVQIEVATIHREDVENEVIQDSQEQV